MFWLRRCLLPAATLMGADPGKSRCISHGVNAPAERGGSRLTTEIVHGLTGTLLACMRRIVERGELPTSAAPPAWANICPMKCGAARCAV
jgi:hypothetical protein